MISALTDQIKQAELERYQAEKVKKVHAFVYTKMFSTFKILRPDALKAWCMKNFTRGLVLDEDAIKKEAVAGGVPSGLAEISEEPRAMIASDLSSFLNDEVAQ